MVSSSFSNLASLPREDGVGLSLLPVDLVALDHEIRERTGRGDIERRLLGYLVRLAVVGNVLIRRSPVQQVALVRCLPGRYVLRLAQSLSAFRLHQLDHSGQAPGPTLQRGPQGRGRASEPALEDRHREARR